MAPPSELTEALSADPSGVASVVTELVRSEAGHFTVARGQCEDHSVSLRSVQEVVPRPYEEATHLSSSQRLRQRWTSVFSIRSSQRRSSALASLVPCMEVRGEACTVGYIDCAGCHTGGKGGYPPPSSNSPPLSIMTECP